MLNRAKLLLVIAIALSNTPAWSKDKQKTLDSGLSDYIPSKLEWVVADLNSRRIHFDPGSSGVMIYYELEPPNTIIVNARLLDEKENRIFEAAFKSAKQRAEDRKKLPGFEWIQVKEQIRRD